METWNFDDAREHLEEVVEQALTAGPQRIARTGGGHVVVMRADAGEDEEEDSAHSLLEFLRASPLAEALGSGELVIDRER
jgi:hypothetical protein